MAQHCFRTKSGRLTPGRAHYGLRPHARHRHGVRRSRIDGHRSTQRHRRNRAALYTHPAIDTRSIRAHGRLTDRSHGAPNSVMTSRFTYDRWHGGKYDGNPRLRSHASADDRFAPPLSVASTGHPRPYSTDHALSTALKSTELITSVAGEADSKAASTAEVMAAESGQLSNGHTSGRGKSATNSKIRRSIAVVDSGESRNSLSFRSSGRVISANSLKLQSPSPTERRAIPSIGPSRQSVMITLSNLSVSLWAAVKTSPMRLIDVGQKVR